MTTDASKTGSSARYHQKYDEEDKTKALSAFLANGCNYHKTARELNIPYPTLRHWVEVSPVVAEIIKNHKKTFSKTSWVVITEGLQALKRRVKSKTITVDELIKVINCLIEKQRFIESNAAVLPPSAVNSKKSKKKKKTASTDTKSILKKAKKEKDTQDDNQPQETDRTIQLVSNDR